jgi:hypothetical protein
VALRLQQGRRHPLLDDPFIMEFDNSFEKTDFPTELLWGPGSYEGALRWLDDARPQQDSRDHTDRWFVIRVVGEVVHLPRDPANAARAAEADASGTWHLLRADTPKDALLHIRWRHGPVLGPCRSCDTEGVASGSWSEVLAAMEARAIDASPTITPVVRVPRHWSWPESETGFAIT